MKIRIGFVSNSSSSSFVCKACSASEVSSDGLPEGWVTCINEHYLCDDCCLVNPEPDEDNYVSQETCPICQFIEIDYYDMARFLLKEYNISRDEVFAEIKLINKRRKKLYDTEYVEAVCKQKNLQVQKVLEEIKKGFETYQNYQAYLRRF
jgi:hypothetical protein